MAVTKPVWWHRYELRSPTPLNSVSKRLVHEGALLRFEESGGFASLHPWPELGDAPLSIQCEYLRVGKSTGLIDQAKKQAHTDGAFRAAKCHWFEDLGTLPCNHWLLRKADSLSEIRKMGFDTVKLKIGPAGSFSEQRELIYAAAREGFAIRLDANESLSKTELIPWWESLVEPMKAAIQFIEDPCPFGEDDWSELTRLGMPLAADREAKERMALCPWIAVKPAVTDVDEIARMSTSQRIVFTSYMDHPLGQMWAAREASRYYRDYQGGRGETCGMLTHHCYLPTPFSERLVVCDTRLQAVEGTGAGFDELLEKLPWKRLI